MNYKTFGKRLFDLIISIIAILSVAPLLMILCVFVLLVDKRPIFFVQTRSGKNGRQFKIFKFRTMSVQVDVKSPVVGDKERITKLGDLLRKTSLDELPSILNVLIGDMSFVGPRPLLPEYDERYDSHQKKRLSVKPGITGWAQINGRNTISWKEKFELDVWYTENYSLLLDLKILIRTISLVFSRKSINFDQTTTMPRFDLGDEIP